MVQVAKAVGELVRDLRRLVMPHTATKLKVKRYVPRLLRMTPRHVVTLVANVCSTNTLKDFLNVAGPLGVTHFVLLSQTNKNVIFRLGKVPHGPTLTFRVEAYSLARQVRAAQKSPVDIATAFEHPPLVVMHGFGSIAAEDLPSSVAGISRHDALRMTVTLIQNMFPQIQPATAKLTDCRRIVLVHYNKDTDKIELRHYYIRAVPVGVSRIVKKLTTATSNKLPDLSKFDDISELAAAGAGASDSEVDDDAAKVVLPQDFDGRGNVKSQQSAIKLAEIGPRLTLSLMKVEQGLCEGDVLYHALYKKTKQEASALHAEAEKRTKAKQERIRIQEANVARKDAERAEKKALKDERRKLRQHHAVAAAAAGTLGDDKEADGDVEEYDSHDERYDDILEQPAGEKDDEEDDEEEADEDEEEEFDDEDDGDFADASDLDDTLETAVAPTSNKRAMWAPELATTAKISIPPVSDVKSILKQPVGEKRSRAEPRDDDLGGDAPAPSKKARKGVLGHMLGEMQAKLAAAQAAARNVVKARTTK
jgi:ribosome biogenesis protein SSF1/2